MNIAQRIQQMEAAKSTAMREVYEAKKAGDMELAAQKQSYVKMLARQIDAAYETGE